MRIKKIIYILLIMNLCLALSGCRIRTTLSGQEPGEHREEQTAQADLSLTGEIPDAMANDAGADTEAQPDEYASKRTKENPEAARKEYDENAPAEMIAGTDREIHGAGEGEGLSETGEEIAESTTKLNNTAERVATQTVPAQQADQMGVSEDADEADAAATYFTVLLQDKTGSLFECQRQNVYWETAENYVTVFKTSLEHSLIVGSGGYDVSARLMEENLRVDDGWVVRKNPGVIVKVVDGNILGTGVSSTAAAQKVYSGLLSRENWKSIDAAKNRKIVILSDELLHASHLQLAAMLIVAKTSDPVLFKDVDIDKMLEMLIEEATGTLTTGIYYYCEQGGF